MGRLSVPLRIAVLAALYFAAAKLGIELSVAQGVVTPVWIPTGLSLAALLVFGYRLWPGVAIGAFVANATSDVSPLVASGIAVGNTLEVVVGTYLLRRFGFHSALNRVRDVLALTLLGALVSTTIAATSGTTVLLLSAEINSADYFSRWSLWWFGDAMGALLVAPVLLVLLSRTLRPDARRWVEGVGLLILVAGTSIFVFVGGNWKYPYLLFPLLIWATLRFRQLGATATIFVISAIAIWGTVRGSVPLGGATPTESVEILQALLAVVGVSLYVMAASLDERDVVARALEDANAGLAEAQRLARAGSWAWDIGTNTVTWSDEMYRIYGYPAGTPMSFETAMERVHEGDAALIRKNIENTVAAKESIVPVVEYRVVRDGEERVLRASGAAHYTADGTPIRMVGTVQDITEQQYLEQQRRLVEEADSRHRQALSLNDDIVQGLAAAKAALELDLPERHEQLVTETLEKARRIVSNLLEEAARTRPLQPGDFTRPSQTD